ncbi:MAG: DNA-processing protein DprA [Parasporobacterium sp.]|nr:DNA-processing protein DprA [Parasporobacterium sp.]
MTQEEYWFWLCNINDIYQDTIDRLIREFGGPEMVFRASADQLIRSGAVGPRRARLIADSKSSTRSLRKLEKLAGNGIRFIYYKGPDYPEKFALLEDRPYAFYVKGTMPDPKMPSVGIVGSRVCSGYGKEMTMKFSQCLASNGVQIISGMALGVDAIASRSAIEAGGKTFVVLGSGLDVIYPRQNIDLYYQILLNQGGIISEFPMGDPPLPWHFPHRNRLISALSDQLLVIEARRSSGSLSTASCALNQGKDVYALPGRITDPMSEGCNRLIADGAGVLLDPQMLLEECFRGRGRTDFEQKDWDAAGPELTGDQKGVYEALDYQPKMLDRIAAESALSCERTAKVLTELELLGVCSEISKDYYRKGT